MLVCNASTGSPVVSFEWIQLNMCFRLHIEGFCEGCLCILCMIAAQYKNYIDICDLGNILSLSVML
jgi:hypothetical protein